MQPASVPQPTPASMNPAVQNAPQARATPPLPSPTAADVPFDDDPLLTDAARAAIREEQRDAGRRPEGVKLVHGSAAPVVQPAPAVQQNVPVRGPG